MADPDDTAETPEGYSYSYPKRRVQRRAGSLRGQIEDAALAELDALAADGIGQTSSRFLYYRLVARRVLDKKNAKHAKQFSIVMTELRETAVIPLDAIRDRTRGVLDYRGGETILDETVAYVKQARLDRWPNFDPILIVESRSLAGVLQPLAIEYAVPLIPLGGQSSLGLFAVEVVPRLQELGPDGTLIFYLGDWDFSGGHIERSARARLEAYCGFRLHWVRLALTEQQVETYGLEVVMKYDERTRSHHPAVETEALDQRVLTRIVTRALDLCQPADRTADETHEREQVLALLQPTTPDEREETP